MDRYRKRPSLLFIPFFFLKKKYDIPGSVRVKRISLMLLAGGIIFLNGNTCIFQGSSLSVSIRIISIHYTTTYLFTKQRTPKFLQMVLNDIIRVFKGFLVLTVDEIFFFFNQIRSYISIARLDQKKKPHLPF